MTYATSKHDLEDHIELLHKLDEARTKSGELMNEGIKVLIDHKEELLKSSRKEMDFSLAIRALGAKLNQPFEKESEQKSLLATIFKLGKELQKFKLKDIEKDDLSVLTAARVLQALVICPGAAFSSTALVCYYLIIRELYTAEGSDWNTGGAPAARGGSVTAFVTGECVRALISFADAQKKTGDFIFKMGEYEKRRKEIKQLGQGMVCKELITDWVNNEQERLYLSCSLTLQNLSRSLVLPIELPHSEKSHDKITKDLNKFAQQYVAFFTSKENPKRLRDELDEFADKLQDNLKMQINVAIGDKGGFSKAIEQINVCRTKEEDEMSDEDHARAVVESKSAHEIALFAVNDVKDKMTQASDYFDISNNKDPFVYCQDRLNEAAEMVRSQLASAKNYLSTVLDRELATVFLGGQWDWQPSELACAATASGSLKYLPGQWAKDARFVHAADQLTKAISRCGRIPSNRPYHIKRQDDPSSYRFYDHFYISNFSALASLALLLRNVTEVAIEPDLIEKIFSFFEETRATFPLENGKVKGWCREEHFPIPRKTELKSTAHAVFALAAIKEMLDVRINHIVLHHFTVKTKNKGLKDELTLDSVFYPDYGLKLAPVGRDLINRPDWIEEKDWPINGIHREKSVAFILQQMYAHVSRVNLPYMYKPLCSLVLHGPAGTGKTTLVEALAVTCEVPLVEVTPSDLVMHGGENIEERARAVFYALSLLTRAVILFDEFDPVLKRRDVANINPQNVFSFLTPGMLPKLKDLHDRAEKRFVAYVLVTNLIGELDESAVRKGRFDERIGIYPPDLLSRVGRFLHQIYDYFVDEESRKFEPEKLPWDRIIYIIKKTEGKGMTTLGKSGWFTRPKKRKAEDETPVGYVKGKSGPDEWPEPDDVFKNIVLGKGKAAVTECLQWQWIDRWDKELSEDATTIADLFNALKKGYSLKNLQEPKTDET